MSWQAVDFVVSTHSAACGIFRQMRALPLVLPWSLVQAEQVLLRIRRKLPKSRNPCGGFCCSGLGPVQWTRGQRLCFGSSAAITRFPRAQRVSHPRTNEFSRWRRVQGDLITVGSVDPVLQRVPVAFSRSNGPRGKPRRFGGLLPQALGLIPHRAVWLCCGLSVIRPWPLLKASGAQVIGSTPIPVRRRSCCGRVSPV